MRRAWGTWAGTALAVLSMTACDNDRNRAAPEPPAGSAAQRPGVDAIKEAPGRYYGKTVSVAGGIDTIYTDRAFELEGAGWAFDDNITVITTSPVKLSGAALRSGDDVVVTGTVRPFVQADIEREFGWKPDTTSIQITKRPVLVATSIRRIGGYGTWPASDATAAVTTSLVIFTSDPALLVGTKVDLAAERVQAVQGKGLWIGPSPMSQVFVMPKDPVKDVQVGDTVHVTGTLQKAPNDAAKVWDLPAGMAGVVGAGTLYLDGATVGPAAKQAASEDRR